MLPDTLDDREAHQRCNALLQGAVIQIRTMTDLKRYSREPARARDRRLFQGLALYAVSSVTVNLVSLCAGEGDDCCSGRSEMSMGIPPGREGLPPWTACTVTGAVVRLSDDQHPRADGDRRK